MNNSETGSASRGTDRFDVAAGLFARYPDLDDADLADLKRWYFKEASAFDVASMASREDVREGYRAFRADHVDRITTSQWAKGTALALLTGGIAYTIFGPILS